MGAILSCYGEKKKSKEEYYREIFDGLDIDGTQTLDAVELQTVWELVKEQKLEKLNNMREKGAIDDEEFKQMKKEILEK